MDGSQEIDLGDWIGAGDFESDDDIPKNGAVNLTARNIIDHSHPVFQNDVKGWLLWLKKDVGFDVSTQSIFFKVSDINLGSIS